ncbi:MAG: Ig-like domain-containing protein [Bacteroidota bacterium]|nr:Ig-like domain-containing protein [Bacteroidota bacterium]
MRKSFTRFLSLLMLFSIFSLFAVASIPVVTVSPASPATNVDPRGGSVTFILTFDQNVLPGTAGAGVIALSNSSDVQLDPVQISGTTNTNPATGSTVVINGKVVTVTFRYSPIPEQTTFYVTATSDALKNAAGEYWAGWRSFGATHDYAFTTGDFTAPTVLAASPFVPADNSSAVAINQIYAVTYTENIQPGTGLIQTGDAASKPGNIGVYKENGDVVEIYDVTTAVAGIPAVDGTVGIVGSTLYINPTDAKVTELGKYYVRILNTALTDMSVNKNKFAGINNNTTWNFQLADLTPPAFTVAPVAASTNIQQGAAMKLSFTDNRTAAGLTFALQAFTLPSTVASIAIGTDVTSSVSFGVDPAGGVAFGAVTPGTWKAVYTAANEITVSFVSPAKFLTGANYQLDVVANKLADVEKNIVVSSPSTFKAGDFTAPYVVNEYAQPAGVTGAQAAPFNLNTAVADLETTKIFFGLESGDVEITSGLATLPTSVKYLVYLASATAPTAATVLASGTDLPVIASNTFKHQGFITADAAGTTLASNTAYKIYYVVTDNATVKNSSALFTSATVTTNDTESPTYTVKYWLGAVEQTATAVDKAGKITVTFNEDVAINTTGTLFSATPSDFASTFTLKQTNVTPNVTLVNGVDFTVTKVSNKVFDIVATHSNWAGTASWMSKGNYSLAINSSKIYDLAGSVKTGTANAAAASTNLFTVKDYEGPTVLFSPTNGTTNVNNNGNITITFSEAPYYLGAPVTQANVDALIELRKGDASTATTGSPLEPRTVTISGNVVTITPTTKPLSSEIYYRASVSTDITDVNLFKLNKNSDNVTAITVPAGSIEYSVFKTADNRTPLVTYTTYVGTTIIPAVQDNVARAAQGLVNVDNVAFPVILLDESVQEIVGNTPIASLDANQIRTLITLKKGDANGANVEFNVLLASTNTGLIPPPTGMFEIVLDPINYPAPYVYDNSGTYYFSISGIQDAAKNPITGSATFSVINATPLTLSSSTPANAATAVAKNGNLVLTFNQNISKTTTSGSFITSAPAGLNIDVTNVAVTVSGNQVTIPYTGFAANTTYTITVPAGVFNAVANNAANGVITRTFTTVDEYGPTIDFGTAALPDESAPNTVALSNGQLSLTFTENIALGNGYIKIRKPEVAGATTVADINVQSSYVIIDPLNAMKVKITIPVTLLYNQPYFVEIPQTAFKDAAGNNFQWSDSDHGIGLHTADVTAPLFPYTFGDATWDFSTVTDATPTYTSFVPAAGTNDVALTAGLTINFSEPVSLTSAGLRELTIYRASDNTTLETINLAIATLAWNATMTQVTVSHLPFEANKGYYINISPATFKDVTGNNVAILNSTAGTGWYFTTQDFTAPTATLTTASGAALTAVPLADNLILTFSEPVALSGANTWATALTLSTGTFAATLDATKKILTINPTNNFASLTSANLTINAGTIQDFALAPNVIGGSVIALTGEDKTAPVWAATYPLGVSPAYAKDKVKFQVALDEKSSVYYMTTLAGALTTSPTAATVRANSVYSYTASPFVANAVKTIEITGLSELTSYDVYVMAEDLFGNQTTVSMLTLYTTDVTAPTMVSLYPANGAVAVNYDHASPAFNGIVLKLRLSEKLAFTASTAKLVVRKYDTNVKVYEADRTTGLTITNSSGTLQDVVTATVPKALLADNTQYYVEFEYDMVTDVNNGLIPAPYATGNNAYADAFIGKADWSFTTADETAPVLAAVAPLTTTVPAMGAIDVAVTAPSVLTLRFSEPIAIGTGTIYIYRVGVATPQEVITLPNVDVVVNPANNKELLITRHNTYASEVSYNVIFPATGVKDLAPVPNYYAGLGVGVWTFTTADITSPAVVWSLANNATSVPTATVVSANFVDPRQTEITGGTVYEPLYNSGVAVVNATDIKSWFTVTANGAAAALTSAIYTSAAPATVTFTVTGGLKSNTTYVFSLNAPATLTDDKGNLVPSSTLTFSTIDNSSPTITFTPAVTTTNVPVNSYVTVKFNKTIYNNNMLSPGTSPNANFTPTAADFATGNYVTFKQGATNVPFTTEIVTPGVEYRLIPSAPLASTTVYDVVWVATRGSAQEVYDRLDLPTENKLDLLIAARTTTFTTEDVVKPTVVSLNPANVPGLTIVNPTAALVMTFSEKVQAGAGNIQIRRGNGQIFAEVPATDCTYSTVVAPWTVTIPHAAFEKFTTYYVIIPEGAITDASNNVNKFAGFADNTKWSFRTDDGTAPTVIVYTPANGSNNIPVFTNLTMQFSENIVVNAGNIVIYYNNGDAGNDGNAIEIIPIGSPKVVISGSNVPQGLTSDVVTVDPSTTFDKLGTFYVRIDNGIVKDFAATPNSFAGISNNTTWAFTVTDNTKPSLLSTSPVNNASGLGVSPTLTMNFDRNVMAGTGNIKLLEYFYNPLTFAYEEKLIESMPVTSSMISGMVVTATPTVALGDNKVYYVLVDNTAITNTAVSKDPWAGISSPFIWRFTTGDNTAPTVAAVPATGGTNLTNTFDVTLTFNETVTGVTTTNVTATGGTLALATVTAGTVYKATVTAADLATVVISLSNGITDANSNALVPVSFTYTVGDFNGPTSTATPGTGVNMPKEFTVIVKFNENVTGAETGITSTGGTAVITKTSDSEYSVALTAAADNSNVVLSIANTVKDMVGNTYAGVASYTYTTGDNTAPIIITTNPNGGALANAHPANFEIFVSEAVVKGTGKLTVYKKAGDVNTMELDAASVIITSVGGVYKITIPLTSNLDRFTDYYVLVSEGFVTDANLNKLAAVTLKTFWTFKTGDWITGLAPKNSSEFKVYPNPFVDHVIVDNASQLSKVVVTNIAGQMVKEVVNPTDRIQLNELRSGIYFMSLYDASDVNIKTAKIVKR